MGTMWLVSSHFLPSREKAMENSSLLSVSTALNYFLAGDGALVFC